MRYLFLLGFLTLTLIVRAQNDPFFSHYMFNRSYYNPAALGVEPVASVAFQMRSQWVGYTSSFDGSGGAPNTQLLSLVAPVKSNYLSGVGLHVLNDNLGPVNNLQIQIPLSYQLNLKRGTLDIGIMPGFFSQTQNFDELRFVDPTDVLNVGSKETQLNPNLAAGIFYNSYKKFFVGVSATNLLEPSFDFGLDSLQNELARTVNAMAGFDFQINSDLVVRPSTLVRYDLNTFTFDLSVLAEYKNLAWGGLSYRRDESVIFMVGYSFLSNNELKVGYALDYVLDEQESKQPTSHEFMIKYNLPNFIFGGRKAIKTPRFSH